MKKNNQTSSPSNITLKSTKIQEYVLRRIAKKVAREIRNLRQNCTPANDEKLVSEYVKTNISSLTDDIKEILSERDYDIVRLSIMNGLDWRTVCKALKIPKTTLYRRLKKVKKTLRAKLDKNRYFYNDKAYVDSYEGKPITFPFEHEQHNLVGKSYMYNKKKKTHTVCTMKPYLDNAFSDDKTICSCCRKCNKERKE